MSKDYRAVVASYGFRRKYWEPGEIALNVTPEENIPEHFVEVSTPVPEKPEPEQEEINTLSQLQEAETPSRPAKKSSKK